MTTAMTEVLVIGAGPSGLTIANLLARSGVGLRILDKKAGPTKESRALVVHAKILELLDKLGLADQAIEEGRRMGTVELLNEGKRAGKISFLDDHTDDRTPYPFILIYEQSQSERLLTHGLTEVGSRVEWGTEMLSLAQTPDGVQVTVRRPDGSEETIEAGWVVGADGAHSPVRRTLSLGFAGETYKQTLFLADVDMEGALEARQVSMDLTRTGFNAFFPLPGGDRRFRIVGDLPTELADRDAITLDELQRVLDSQSRLHVNILRARWISVYRTHHRITEQFRVGRVFLVGDAAHIHSPAGGQGMNTGIGDAYNLAWKLALVVKGHAREELLDSYEAERMPFARAILHSSDQGFHVQSTTNPVGQRLKIFLVPLLFRLLSLLSPLRRRAFWLLSQLWTSYRNSPAVAESGPVKKGPRAGDRTPYGFFEDGPDIGKSIFTTLKGVDHHLLLFAGKTTDSPLADTHQVEEHLHALLDAYSVPIHLHLISARNRSLHKRYGADVLSLFLVRPDGHIAYRSQADDLDSLRAYLNKQFGTGKEKERTRDVEATVSHDEA